MPTIDRRSVIMLLLGVDDSPDTSRIDAIGGITRLQKLLYLLEVEEKLTPTEDGFDFSAWKAGPYSSKLYDDLEFLENLGFIEGEVTADATAAEASEVSHLEFDDLMGDGAESTSNGDVDGFGAADAYEERQFKITPDGKSRIEALISRGEYEPVIDGIRRIKRKYGAHSLSDLLYYVYTKYPDMTVESEIKDQVLKSRR